MSEKSKETTKQKVPMLCFVFQAKQTKKCAKATEQPSEQKQYPFGNTPQVLFSTVLVETVQQKGDETNCQVGNYKNFDDKFLMLRNEF